jgi:hypothetical protein
MSEGGNDMEITIKVDGGQAKVSGPGEAAPRAEAPTPGSADVPPDVLARAAATGAIAAGPAPSVPSGPGASSELVSPSEPAASGGTDMAAGAAPGQAPDQSVDLPAADDDTEEEGD